MKKTETIYLKEENLVLTELSGELNASDVDEWQQSLKAVLQKLEPNTKFKILVNLYGFKA